MKHLETPAPSRVIDPALAVTNVPNDILRPQSHGPTGSGHELTGFIHRSELAGSTPPVLRPTSSLGSECGTNPAWGASLSRRCRPTSSGVPLRRLVVGRHQSLPNGKLSTTPFIDYTPPDGGPTTYSGGVWWPWDYVTWRQQFRGKATYYTENFLNSQHEFKFGVQYSEARRKPTWSVDPTGRTAITTTGYFYRSYRDPYNMVESLGPRFLRG